MMSQNRACSEISSDLFGRIHNKSQISGSEIHDRRPGLANRSSTPQTGRQLAGDRSKDVRCTTDALRVTVCMRHVPYTTTCLTLQYRTVPVPGCPRCPPDPAETAEPIPGLPHRDQTPVPLVYPCDTLDPFTCSTSKVTQAQPTETTIS